MLAIWPAFYESSPGNILWIVGGEVVNGCWRPTFSEDRLTCWHNPEHKSRWVASAPSSGNYNDVIDTFLKSLNTKENKMSAVFPYDAPLTLDEIKTKYPLGTKVTVDYGSMWDGPAEVVGHSGWYITVLLTGDGPNSGKSGGF